MSHGGDGSPCASEINKLLKGKRGCRVENDCKWGGVRPERSGNLRVPSCVLSKGVGLQVDPPRAGLDDKTVELVRQFDNIVYISCNPTTLHENLGQIGESHHIKRFALFDQFPYTDHIECGVFLKRRT